MIATRQSSTSSNNSASSSTSSLAFSSAGSPSLLNPPNPALAPNRPTGSILLNRNDSTCQLPNGDGSNKGKKVASVLKGIKDSFSWQDVPGQIPRGRVPGPPASSFNNRARSSSTASSASYASQAMSTTTEDEEASRGESGSSTSFAGTRKRAPSVTFAPLPEVPELHRRRSITLGVAARSNMLKTQGSPARSNTNTIYMTEAEWEEYQRQRGIGVDPPEIHTLVMDGTKKLWQKAKNKRNRNGSSSSNDTNNSGDQTAQQGDQQKDQQSGGGPSNPIARSNSINVASLARARANNQPQSEANNVNGSNTGGAANRPTSMLGLTSGNVGSSTQSVIASPAASENDTDPLAAQTASVNGSSMSRPVRSGVIAVPEPESIPEVDEEYQEADMMEDPDGGKIRSASFSTTATTESSGSTDPDFSRNGEDEEEDFENDTEGSTSMGSLPAYLRKDFDAERAHYSHHPSMGAAHSQSSLGDSEAGAVSASPPRETASVTQSGSQASAPPLTEAGGAGSSELGPMVDNVTGEVVRSGHATPRCTAPRAHGGIQSFTPNGSGIRGPQGQDGPQGKTDDSHPHYEALAHKLSQLNLTSEGRSVNGAGSRVGDGSGRAGHLNDMDDGLQDGEKLLQSSEVRSRDKHFPSLADRNGPGEGDETPRTNRSPRHSIVNGPS